MSLFRSTMRPSASVTDALIERYLERLRADLGPDPVFRRRLRGRVVNGYVAAREGVGIRRAAGRGMTRIGRAVLYASFVLGVSVTGAMAASQHAIPGDAFYVLKLDIEALRYRVVPDHLHDELAAHALAERMVELDRLADAGSTGAIAEQSLAVEEAFDKLLVLGGGSSGVEDRLALVAAIVQQLPRETRAAMDAVLSDAAVAPAAADLPAESSGGAEPGNAGGNSGRGETGRPADGPPGSLSGYGSAATGSPPTHAAAPPEPENETTATPSPTPTPEPTESDQPTAKPTPRAEVPNPTRPPHPHASP